MPYSIEELLRFFQHILEMGVGKRRAKDCEQGIWIRQILEDMIPQRPLWDWNSEWGYIWVCPKCKEPVYGMGVLKPRHCEACGKPLVWKWAPKVGEDFFCWNLDGDVMSRNRTWELAHCTEIDEGNCFKTKEECESHTEIRDKLIKSIQSKGTGKEKK